MPQPHTTSDDDKASELIAAGADLAGTLATTAAGFLVAGPIGAFGGAVSGLVLKQALTKVGADIHDRMLGPRERVRIGAAGAYAIARIERNLGEGKPPRDDGFFEEKKHGRSQAEEVLEGVLLKAKNDHEEKKAQYLGNLFGNVAFDPYLSASEANLILKYAEEMTYRELLCVALLGKSAAFNLRASPFPTQVTYTTLGILHELYDLARNDIIRQQAPGSDAGEIILELRQIVPAHLSLRAFGQIIYAALGLDEVPHDEVEQLVAKYLRHGGSEAEVEQRVVRYLQGTSEAEVEQRVAQYLRGIGESEAEVEQRVAMCLHVARYLRHEAGETVP